MANLSEKLSQNYDDLIKLLSVINENLSDIAEAEEDGDSIITEMVEDFQTSSENISSEVYTIVDELKSRAAKKELDQPNNS